MDYREMIVKALNGRSVNATAKEWGLPQKTLESYVKEKCLPDYDTALMMANAAGIGVEEAFKMLAKEAKLRKKNAKKIAAVEKFSKDFKNLVSRLDPRRSLLLAR
jgi:DNA-binding XRE family transcriptional regulator